MLHPTSLPGGRLGPEAYRFVDWLARRRPELVAGAAARAARRARLAVRVGLGLRRLERLPRGAGGARHEARRSTPSGARTPTGPATGSDAGQTWPTRCASSASGRRSATYARERGIGLIGDVPIYVAQGSVDQRTHPELFLKGSSPERRRTRSGRAASTGGTRSSTGPQSPPRATAGGSSGSAARSRSSTSSGSTTSAASRGSGRSRRARRTRARGPGCRARAPPSSGPRRPSSAHCR